MIIIVLPSILRFKCESTSSLLIHSGSFFRLSIRLNLYNIKLPWTHFVGEDHQAEIRFASKNSTNTLRGLPELLDNLHQGQANFIASYIK